MVSDVPKCVTVEHAHLLLRLALCAPHRDLVFAHIFNQLRRRHAQDVLRHRERKLFDTVIHKCQNITLKGLKVNFLNVLRYFNVRG